MFPQDVDQILLHSVTMNRLFLLPTAMAYVGILTSCGAPSVTTPPQPAPAAAASSTAMAPASASAPTAAPAAASTVAATPELATTAALLPDEPAPAGAEAEFKTDFKRHTVPYGEILSGGPPKDGIPAIDAPAFVTVADADRWLSPTEAVALVVINGDARAYPIQVLMWHEIVNDRVAEVPVAVTYCPLCNTAIVFERAFDGATLDFGTTGRLRFSNMVMYDRQSETWWQQGTGAGIAGKYAGQKLVQRPVSLIAWSDFKSTHPTGKVLSKETGLQRAYGLNPYAGYDAPDQQPFLYKGPSTSKELSVLARVLALDVNGDAIAFPYDVLAQRRVATDTVGGQPVVVFWSAGVASPLDAVKVAEGRDVGAAAAFSRQLDGHPLDFVFADGKIRDTQTGSTWSHLGRAVDGPLKDKQLAEATAVNHFWFSWVAFFPATRVWTPPGT